jgi:FRG domain
VREQQEQKGEDVENSESNSSDIEVTTLIDFITNVTKFAGENNDLKCYRGQKNKAWRNAPGIYRPVLKNFSKNEKLAIRDLISIHPEEFLTDHTMFDRLVRMQHYGLPTRLLDVSLNPLIALYFATESKTVGVVTAFSMPNDQVKYYDSDSVSCIANLANLDQEEKNEIINSGVNITRIDFNKLDASRKLCQFIRAEKSYFENQIRKDDLFRPYYVHPKMSNRRISAQAGGFIIFGLKKPNTTEIKKKQRFIIPIRYKEEIRKSLKLLGVTASTLFPELDRAAAGIKEKYL